MGHHMAEHEIDKEDVHDRTFSSRDKLTLFKALVMSRLDYG